MGLKPPKATNVTPTWVTWWQRELKFGVLSGLFLEQYISVYQTVLAVYYQLVAPYMYNCCIRRYGCVTFLQDFQLCTEDMVTKKSLYLETTWDNKVSTAPLSQVWTCMGVEQFPVPLLAGKSPGLELSVLWLMRLTVRAQTSWDSTWDFNISTWDSRAAKGSWSRPLFAGIGPSLEQSLTTK